MEKIKTYNLKAGSHTLAIANGEAGARLDKIYISNVDIAPTGMGETAIQVCNSVVYTIPGRIETESYSFQTGVTTATTGDSDGILDAGSMDVNDWMEYFVNIPKDTVYKVTFRCAVPIAGAMSILVNEKLVDNISFTSTGSLKTYNSFSEDIPLKIGRHILKFVVTTGGFNFNWFMLERANATGIDVLKATGLSIFPNPTKGELNIDSQNFLFENIDIFDVAGKKLFTKNVEPAKLISIKPDLQKGIYIYIS